MKNIFKNGLISRFVMMILFVFGLNTIVSSPALAAVTVKYMDDTGVQCATSSSTNCSAVTSCNGKIVSMWEEKAFSDALLSPNDVCGFLEYAESQGYYTVTLTANTWTPITYTVKFDANGGSGTMSNQTFTYDSAKKLTKNTYTRTDYEFLGWSTNKSALSATYTDEQSVKNLSSTSGATVTLYAIWKTTVFSVVPSINGNGNTGGTKPSTFSCTTKSCVLPENKFTKTGYTFAGWEVTDDCGVFQGYIGSSGDNLAIGINECIQTTNNLTLTATWTINKYTVKFDANGGTGSMADQSRTYDDNVELSANQFTRADYQFAGWATAPDATEAHFVNKTRNNITAKNDVTITLYALWLKNVFSTTMSFSGGGATGGTAPGNITCSSAGCVLPENKFTRTGYTFAGWEVCDDPVNVFGCAVHPAGNNLAGGIIAAHDGIGIVAVATWTPNKYKVIFNGNGADGGSMDAQTFTYDVAQTLTKNAYSRANYRFIGWSADKNATTATYTDEQSVKNLVSSGNKVLYAVWEAFSVVPSIYGNGNTGGTKPETFTCNSISCVMPENKFTKTGYTFAGWEVTDDCSVFNGYIAPSGDELAEGINECIQTTNNLTLTATWKPITYTVKFDANGGSGSTMSNMSFTYDSAKKLTKNTYTRTDYEFLGWSTNKNALSATYTDEQSVKNLSSTSGATVTLYAIWKTTVFSVVPSINGNGNTGGTKPSTFSCTTKSCVLPENKFTKTGYTFAGWEVTDDCGVFQGYIGSSGDNLAIGINECIQTTNNLTLTATWTINKYTVKFDANGGTGSMADQSRTYDDNVELSANQFTRADYQFAGWATVPNATEARFVNKTRSNITAENGVTVTLYALWLKDVFSTTMSFNGGDATGGTAPGKITCSSAACVLPNNTFTRTGYTFAGWEVCDDPVNVFGCAVHPAGNNLAGGIIAAHDGIGIVAVATWTPNKYKVIFNGNGADGGSMDAQTFTYDVAQTLTKNAYTRENYVFVGWSADRNATTATYTDGQSVKNLATTGTELLYAIWKTTVFSVVPSIYGNGNTGGTKPETFTCNSISCKLPENKFTKTGYTFAGWEVTDDCGVFQGYIGSSGDNLAIGINECIQTTNNLTLTATWTINKYTVKFDANGGTGSMADQSRTYDDNVELSANQFTRADYQFAGWATVPNATEARFVNKTRSNITAENGVTVTLYALWLKDVFSTTMSFNGGDATGGTAPGKITCSSAACVLPNNTFTRTGYTFAGWEVCDDPVNVFGCAVHPAGNNLAGGIIAAHDGIGIVAVATWTPNKYKVIFNGNGADGGSMDAQTFTYDVAQTLTKNAYTRENYVFVGWSADRNATTATYTDGQSVKNLATTGTELLYAIWKTTVFSVVPSIYGNGNTGGTKPETFTCNSISCKLPENKFTKTGYTFAGWEVTDDCGVFQGYIGSSGDNLAIGINECIQTTNNLTLTATWTINKYTVKFDANGGTGSMADQSRTYDDNVELSANQFTRADYQFAGWATVPNATEARFVNKTRSNITAENGVTVTLYALWLKDVFSTTMSFNGGDATGGTAPGKITCSSAACVLPNNTFTRTGYTFAGWEVCDDPVNVFGCAVHPAGNNLAGGIIAAHDGIGIVAVATWTPNKYKVIFNGNGADGGSMDAQTFTYDVAQTLTKNAYTRENYVFVGWSADRNATTATYTDGQSVKNLATTGTELLYAIWKTTVFSVVPSIYGNGNTGGTKPETFTCNSISCKLPENKFTKTGYTFAGWEVTDDCSVFQGYFGMPGDDLATGISECIQTTNNLTLTATWTINKYTVKFDANGGTGSMADQSRTYDDNVELSANQFTRADYQFAGWATVPNATEARFVNKTRSNITAENGVTVTLYALWLKDVFSTTMSFNGGDATGGTAPGKITCSSAACVLPNNTFTRTGYTFAGWEVCDDPVNVFGCSVYRAGENLAGGVRAAHDGIGILAIATWTPNQYRVTFSGNGATGGSMDAQTFTYDVAQTLTKNAYTRENYVFVGWAADRNATTATYTDGQSVKNLASSGGKVLYAVWKTKKITINYQCADGVTTKTQDCFGDNNMCVLDPNACSKSGYYFDYYKFTAVGSSLQNEIVGKSEDIGPSIIAEMNIHPGDFWNQGAIINLIPDYKELYTITIKANASCSDLIGTMPSTITNCTNVSCVLPDADISCTGYKKWNKVWLLNNAISFNDAPFSVGEDLKDMVQKYHQELTDMPVMLLPDWKPITYTITYDANKPANVKDEVSGIVEPTQHVYNTGTKVRRNTYSLRGYTAVGWNTKADGTGVTIDDDEIVDNMTNIDGDNITLYSVWSKDVYNVKMSFNTGGTAPSVMNCSSTSCVLPENTFIKTGYTFAGWEVCDDPVNVFGCGVYPAGEDLAGGISAAHDGMVIGAVATWTPNTYTVRFNANGGSGTMTNQSFTYNVAQKLTTNSFTYKDHLFVGWNTKLDGTGTSYSNAESVKNLSTFNGGDVTLYAIWKPYELKIVYAESIGDGVAPINPIVCDVDSACVLPDNTYSKIGYNFVGWGCTGKSYCDDNPTMAAGSDLWTYMKFDNFTDGASIVVYPKLVPNEYTVTFNSNNSNVQIRTQLFTYDTAQKLSQNIYMKPGYTFLGWSLDKDATTAQYTNAQSVKNLTDENNGNVTLYAVWKVHELNIVYSGNGSSGVAPTSPIVCSIDSACVLPANPYSRIGYDFVGWGCTGQNSCDEDPTMPVGSDMWGYVKFDSFADAESIVLQPKWAPRSYTCNAGEYLDLVSCLPCEAGYRCPESMVTYTFNGEAQGLIECNGKSEYQDLTGQTSCKHVDDGYYRASNIAQKECGNDYYCKNGERTMCPNNGKTDDKTSSSKTQCYKTDVVCETERGFGKQTCYYSEQTNSYSDCISNVCKETSCKYNYEMINGDCELCVRDNALSFKEGAGNCVVETCLYGFYPFGQTCVADTKTCTIAGAISAEQKWNPKTNSYGPCMVTQCAENLHIEANACVPDVQSCEIAHGIGEKVYNHDLNKWNDCIATSCQPGYTTNPMLTNEAWEQCGQCNNMYGANGERVVSSYLSDCKIATCMYQGEKYILENNECRLICDKYSDETGSRYWNGSKCVHDCKPGFLAW